MKLLPFALVLAMLAPPVIAAEPLGRLFYSPDQRSQLDGARTKRVRGGDKADEPPPPPTPEIVTYGGVVRRSDGKTTVWLNNRAVTAKDSAEARMLGKVRSDGTVTLQSSQTGRQVDLRVGQRADLLSGQVQEGYRRAPLRPEQNADLAGGKLTTETTSPPDAERRRDDRERQENLDDAVRAMRDAAQARSASVPPPPQESGGPVTVFPAPMQSPAPGTAPAPTPYR